MPYFSNWHKLGAFAGYLMISPNYRGSQGHRHANTCIGIYDWPDCESMIDKVMKQGWADPEQLGVAGWSYGSVHYFTRRLVGCLGCDTGQDMVQSCYCGAAATDWEGMVMESTSPEQNLRKCDECVPVGQAYGLYHELKRFATPQGQEAAQLVVYLHEPHRSVESDADIALAGKIMLVWQSSTPI
ncbi:hypothetical protein P691DRAFT_785321 [Macrolepiota fuliginosa MF-IS2]|uniref:Peptidase S9 prolyl oligopeptidase catalytic domain-containing protein n=1 Tax=Macrolepiota fuliginosa MF-IS2 TaxID=1400762 RepID=A0A9P5WXK4_9AGAR|nr:hypothetical protein P691DRAFT_785321 [Macrolepiota fuliginosa MF-IS2]